MEVRFCIHYLMICREAKYNYSVDCNLSKRSSSSFELGRLKNASFVRIILMLLFLPFKATEWVEAAIGEKSITLDKNEEKVTVAQGGECLGLEVSFAAKSLDEVGFFKERFRNSLSWVLIEQWPDPVTAHNRCATSKVSLFLSSSGSEMAVQSGGDGGWVLVAISSFIVNKSSIVDRISILLSDGIAESIKPAWQITLPFSAPPLKPF